MTKIRTLNQVAELLRQIAKVKDGRRLLEVVIHLYDYCPSLVGHPNFKVIEKQRDRLNKKIILDCWEGYKWKSLLDDDIDVLADMLDSLQSPSPFPNDLITLEVAVHDYNVTRITLLRYIWKHTLKSYRSPNLPENAPHLVSRAEVAQKRSKK